MTISGEYRAARALDYFHQGYNCSQSVFTAFADVCGLSEETALRLSSPLGAGIGRMREVCGAFCGLSMVAGSLHGNTSPDTGEKEKIFSLVQSLAADFKKEFGTLYCRELLGLTPEQLAGETARPGDRTAASLRKTGRFNHERREILVNGRPCRRSTGRSCRNLSVFQFFHWFRPSLRRRSPVHPGPEPEGDGEIRRRVPFLHW